MARLPLVGGAYQARSIIANCQRCVNLFPEKNQADAPVPLTHYQRPGFRSKIAAPAVAPVRGLYRASNGNGYCVIGQGVYSISTTWALTHLGDLTTAASTPVSFSDNGTTVWLVDGSTSGYQIVLATGAFSTTVDPTGIFTGADKVDYIDTFMLWNVPGTNQFGSTLSNSITFDGTYIASKTDFPDPLQSLIVNRHEILLIGQLKTELWYDSGGANFPFAELPGTYFEHGTCAKYSVASQDISTYFLGQDLQGQGIVFRIRGYDCVRVSTHAIETAIQGYVAAGMIISDAIGYTYQQGGHVFYVLTFPTADATWVFDEASELWHERGWTDADGNLHRDRSNCAAFINGLNVVGDWQNGTIYQLDQNYYYDQVNGIEGAISYIRGFPHVQAGIGPQGQPILADGKRIKFKSFSADMECGTTSKDQNGDSPTVSLRYSDDRGRTYSNAIQQSAGSKGEYLTQPQWRVLGEARDRVFELSWSFAGPAALNSAWIDAEVLAS